MKNVNHTDAQMIREVFDSFAEIFTHPTSQLFEKLFTQDCDYITFDGTHLKGIEENYFTHKRLAELWIFKGASLKGEIISLKFLNENTAVVLGKGGIKFRWQKTLPESRKSINTTVFVKENNVWKVKSFQNTRIKPMGILQRLITKFK